MGIGKGRQQEPVFEGLGYFADIDTPQKGNGHSELASSNKKYGDQEAARSSARFSKGLLRRPSFFARRGDRQVEVAGRQGVRCRRRRESRSIPRAGPMTMTKRHTSKNIYLSRCEGDQVHGGGNRSRRCRRSKLHVITDVEISLPLVGRGRPSEAEAGVGVATGTDSLPVATPTRPAFGWPPSPQGGRDKKERRRSAHRQSPCKIHTGERGTTAGWSRFSLPRRSMSPMKLLILAVLVLGPLRSSWGLLNVLNIAHGEFRHAGGPMPPTLVQEGRGLCPNLVAVPAAAVVWAGLVGLRGRAVPDPAVCAMIRSRRCSPPGVSGYLLRKLMGACLRVRGFPASVEIPILRLGEHLRGSLPRPTDLVLMANRGGGADRAVRSGTWAGLNRRRRIPRHGGQSGAGRGGRYPDTPARAANTFRRRYRLGGRRPA